jgi:hypothetical protein
MDITVGQFKKLIKGMIQQKLANKQIEFAGKGEKAIPKKFPTVEETLVKLMTDQYPVFVEDIWWVAPRPTTFRVKLKNGDSFFMAKNDLDWTIQVQGKKYQLPSLDAEQRAAESISDMLKYGVAKPGAGGETAPPAGDVGTATELPPAEETPPVETPEETPPAEA